jgi:putative PIN family toxin of toxin-antitoxin system
MTSMRAVVDTGVLVSGLIQQAGTTGEILRLLRDGRFSIIFSTPILVEVIEVLGRPPFRSKYHIQPDDINALVNLIRLRGELVTIEGPVTACRDPKDNKFLEAAQSGQVDAIVSGDADLLDLVAFESIPILRPAEFLARLGLILNGNLN